MKLSLEWLKQYVDLSGLSPEDIAYKLTMATAEVEDVERIDRAVSGVVIGEIVDIEPVATGDDSKTIQYATVSVGGKTYRTICGAPNASIGVRSAFAAPGTVLAGGFTVREQDVYGRKSSGMLCSPRELGWGESHAGIMVFPESMTVGAELGDMVPAVDHLIDIDNKSITHRPDLWGHYGFARELSAIYGRELKPLPMADATLWNSLPAFPLAIEDYDGCPGYCCLDVDNLKPAYSPLLIQYLLLAIGLRPINLLVDLTNFIMCEMGQPMHAFDGERVRDVIVAPFGSNGKFATLDSIARDMLPEDLMIKDHTGAIAIAGIMGGEESEIKEDTSRLLLESANFHPASIRRTAIRLGLRTDASLRFEKGQPPWHMGLSIRRFVQLLQDAGQQPQVKSSLTCAGDNGEIPRTLTMSAGYIAHTIGMDIPRDTIVSILTSLGFKGEIDGDDLRLTIPRHRSARDIGIPNDIVEEVARIYGYDNIEPTMPEVEMRAYTFNPELQMEHKMRRFLSVARGYNEVHTYSWYDENWLKRLGYDPEALRLQNPAAANTVRMRRDLAPNLLALVETNSAHRDSFSLYELGDVFVPTDEGCRHVMTLAALGYRSERLGSLQDLFLSMKGAVEELFVLNDAGVPEFLPSQDTGLPWCIPGACMDVMKDGRFVGRIGYLTDKIMPVFEKGSHVVWYELETSAINGRAWPEVCFEEPPVYPGSWMDFTIMADADAPFSGLKTEIERFSHPILRSYRFLYSYEGKGMPEGKLSYSFRFWLGLRDRTLTGEDLTGFREMFLAFLDGLGLSLR